MLRACFGKSNTPKEDARGGSRSKPSLEGAQIAAESICQPSTPTRNGNVCQRPRNAIAQASTDGKPVTGPKSAASATSTGPAGNASGLRSRLNATKMHEMDAENVIVCDAAQIVDGLRLKQHELGRGTYGIVVTGTYRGVNCAVKVMLSAGLDRAALREVLLGPSLVHPNIVSTIAARAAHLSHDFFDLLEGGSFERHDNSLPRTLEPLPINSGDGFGEPLGLNEGLNPMTVLHQILHALGAETGKMVVIIVQEYCDRGTLEKAICKKIFQPSPLWSLRLARRTLLRTAGEVARGLIYLHDAGVVHGDLKPANVLLSSSQEDRRGFCAKLGDFGLAHVLPGAALSLMTKSWGSIAYMAPEAFSGKVSCATDVWAFGVILWEMFTGTRPYLGMGQREVIQGIQSNTLVLPWPDSAPMSAGIIKLGRHCLSFNPADRPSVDTVVEQLVAIEREIRTELLGPQPGVSPGGQLPLQRGQQQQVQKQEQQKQHQEVPVSDEEIGDEDDGGFEGGFAMRLVET